MSFEYIQDYYKVPAETGRVVEFTGDKEPRRGVIVGCTGHYIKLQFDGEPKPQNGPYHPTWEIRYLDEVRTVEPKKLTRSQQRYQDYLNADIGWSFAEWIRFARR